MQLDGRTDSTYVSDGLEVRGDFVGAIVGARVGADGACVGCPVGCVGCDDG